MSTWVYIRGWLEFCYGHRPEIETILSKRADGWTFPEGNWLDAACYARAVRAQEVNNVLDQIRQIAVLPAIDEDNDRIRGLFLVFHEEEGQSEWQVRDGEVIITPAPPRYDYLWE